MQPVTAGDRFAEWLHAATGYEEITLGPVLIGGNSNVTRVIETRQGRLVLRHPPVNVVSDKDRARIPRHLRAPWPRPRPAPGSVVR